MLVDCNHDIFVYIHTRIRTRNYEHSLASILCANGLFCDRERAGKNKTKRNKTAEEEEEEWNQKKSLCLPEKSMKNVYDLSKRSIKCCCVKIKKK